jgi:hypothetical protein
VSGRAHDAAKQGPAVGVALVLRRVDRLIDDHVDAVIVVEEPRHPARQGARFAAGPRIEIDDAYIGGEGVGRGRRGHTPFIMAVETSADGRPLYARLQVVRGFQAGQTRQLCARVEPGTTIVSDGGQWFRCIGDQPGIAHERHVTGSDVYLGPM